MGADLPLLFLEGILAFISPCMLPMLPVYLMYLAAETENGRKASVVNTIGFVCGFTLIFMALGASATALGAMLNEHRIFLQRASGVVIMIFGLHFLGVFRIAFLDIEKKFELKANKSGFLGAILFGAAFSLGWTPCLGPFLGSALMLAGNGKTVRVVIRCGALCYGAKMKHLFFLRLRPAGFRVTFRGVFRNERIESWMIS